ncbi:channel protein TolC [Variovorax guangxiensis]|uniref:Channel protein TolC n=1 Tax=Variovorax guangxiensis TaxID=1775474 RepID=A0A3S0XTU0_9BURK|nr:TolC family outer membrane protein [Variovorax guangxiensis]RUR69353.1 channel protein TolC [Variovorax guangxiensis]
MKRNVLAFAAAGLLWGPAWSLDLSQAYAAALEQDSTIRSVRAATDARRERLPQARAQLLPNLSASVSRHRNWLERTSPDASGQLVTSDLRYTSSSEVLSLRQPIFRMYQMADYRQAQAQVDDAEAVLERELQNVGVRVSGAYFEALLAEEHLALVLSQKTAYTTQLDAAQKRVGAGFGTRTDIDEARAALDLNVAQELEARQNLDFTRRQLQSLVNRPIDGLAPLDPLRMRLVRPTPDRVEDWIEQAGLNSPELRSLGAQLEAARHELEKARAGHYPTLDAIAQWSRNDSDTITSIKTRYSNRSIGLQLNIPLYSGGHVSSTVRQAHAGRQRAEEDLEALRRDLGVRLHREFRGVTEGILRVKALEQAVRSAEQVVISNRRSFEAGSRTLPDVLNAEQQKVSAQRDLAQARFVYLMSRIRLQALSGGDKAEVIDEINGWLTR